ncbi:MAG: heat-inducible transcription repressor HrcA [Blastocatellia bacterium]|jgi:heat-inducible transcriptional repressor|nr:heat-inducible transcription repressor HrcA [Blastocatellia bacterium]MBK6428221.1 heat-inducible transcription repressor HrcA [Blastocatellia bacterium]
MRRARDFTFDDRSREILTTAIRLFVATGEPVGSRALSRLSREGLSAATIRNIVADLEEAGYLYQPHTSAGRIPTDKGYRFYVDNLIGQLKISKHDEARIQRGLIDEETMLRPESLMERTSQMLSQVSDNVGVVVSLSRQQDSIEQVEFIKLNDGRVLAVTVLRGGELQNRIFRLDEDISQTELDRTARYMTENYRGQTLTDIREHLLAQMSEEHALYDRLLQTAILVCERGLVDDGVADVYVDGASTIIEKPDFADTERMRSLFRMFEEKSRLVKLLDQCLTAPLHGGVHIQIGAETRTPWLRDCAIIASPLHVGDRVIGGIGVVGPSRMEYARVIGIVDYVAKLFERTLLDSRNIAVR